MVTPQCFSHTLDNSLKLSVETKCRTIFFSDRRMYENDMRNREPLEGLNHLKLQPHKQEPPHLRGQNGHEKFKQDVGLSAS